MPRSPLVVKKGSRQRRRVSSSMPTPVSLTSTMTDGVAARVGCDDARREREHAAFGHRVDGVEDQIGERFADLALDAHDRRAGRRQLGLELDDDAALLRHVAPARAGEVEDLPDQRVEVHGRQRQLRLALAIELAHARNGLRDVVDGALDGLEYSRAAVAQARLALEQRFGVQRHRRDGVVDVVRDAARHLPERAQPLLLHDGLLGLAQVSLAFSSSLGCAPQTRSSRTSLSLRTPSSAFLRSMICCSSSVLARRRSPWDSEV